MKYLQLIWISTGHPGSASDSEIWRDCQLRQDLEEGRLNLPPPKGDLHYHLIGDQVSSLGIIIWPKGFCVKIISPTIFFQQKSFIKKQLQQVIKPI